MADHCYLPKPFGEYWIDEALKVKAFYIKFIQSKVYDEVLYKI